MRVRLGIEPDLKITGHLFDRFQSLDQDTTVRLISSNPPSLARFFPPIFNSELLDSAQILGLGLTLGNPVKARLIMKMKSAKAAEQLTQSLRENPQQWLRLEESELLLFSQPPEVVSQGTSKSDSSCRRIVLDFSCSASLRATLFPR